MRVRYLVQDDERAPVECGREVVPVGFGQGLRLERSALMDGLGTEQTVEIARANPLDREGDLADRFADAALGVFGEKQTKDAPGRVLQRGLDGMEAKEP